MKLNKVMALALSGIMAVSMLAGCKGTDGEDSSSSTVVTPVSNAVSVMNDAQSIVKFEADADLDAALAAAAKKATYADVSKAKYAFDTDGISTSDAVYEALIGKLPANEMGNAYIDFGSTATSAVRGQSTTKGIVYTVNANGLTEKAALEMYKKLVSSNLPSIVKDNNSKQYNATYTGAVSVVTANVADGGKTASAYYIAISVTQTVAMSAIDA